MSDFIVWFQILPVVQLFCGALLAIMVINLIVKLVQRDHTIIAFEAFGVVVSATALLMSL